MAKKVKTSPYDPADYIETPEDVAAHLAVAFEDGDPAFIARTIGVIARSKGMTEIACETGRSREALYRTFSEDGNPTLTMTLQVLKTLGCRLAPVPDGEDRAA